LIGSWYGFTELTDGQWRIDVPLRIAVPLIVVSVVSWVVVFILIVKALMKYRQIASQEIFMDWQKVKTGEEKPPSEVLSFEALPSSTNGPGITT
jgi:hypothetical protein